MRGRTAPQKDCRKTRYDKEDSFSVDIREISSWPDWKVVSMMDKDNDLDYCFYQEILSVRKNYC